MTDISTATAQGLERAFLSGLNDAQDAYEQIVQAEAWKALGFAAFADWWNERVRPVMRALSMRPTREIAVAVIGQVRTDEADLPQAQRRTQRELAEMVGVDRSALASRDGSRSAPRDFAPPSDLGELSPDEVVDLAELEDRIRTGSRSLDVEVLVMLLRGKPPAEVVGWLAMAWHQFEAGHAGDEDFLGPVRRVFYTDRVAAVLAWPNGWYGDECLRCGDELRDAYDAYLSVVKAGG